MNSTHQISIKVCGMRESKNILDISTLEPNFMGFIFYKKSPRYVSPESVKKMSVSLPGGIRKVGVFVNEPVENLCEISNFVPLDLVQLHGDETPEYCKELKKQSLKVIKAFRVSDDLNASVLMNYEKYVDYFLFDTYSDAYGGSGEVFDWDKLKKLRVSKPYFLSGGIGLGNIDQALKQQDKQFFAVDVNSKIELKPGLKDVGKFRTMKLIVNDYVNKGQGNG